jgi:hypothetical protein
MRGPIKAPVILASLAAGPIFVVATALAAAYLQLPRALDATVDPHGIAALILLPIPVVLFGFILSFVPNLIGTALLLLAGFEFPTARTRAAWIATGALFGTGIAWQTTGFEVPAAAFGLISTSACCAAICRKSALWD